MHMNLNWTQLVVEGSPSREGLLGGLEYTISKLVSIWLLDTVMDYP